LWLVQLGKPGLWWWFISRMPISITDLGRIPGGSCYRLQTIRRIRAGLEAEYSCFPDLI
jgi:hypothetical protein